MRTRRFFLSLICTFSVLQFQSLFSQTLSPKVIASAGGYFTGGGVTLSWTLGEPFQKTWQNGNVILTEGQQQPDIQVKLVNIKAFIEGFYLPGGTMNAAIDPIGQPNDCDTLVLQLASSEPPYSIVFSDTSIMLIDGTVLFNLPSVTVGSQYYFVLRHRNSIETWSQLATITRNMTYDFSTAASKAFGDNQIYMGDNNYAIFSGDIVDANSGIIGEQDGIVESSDYSVMENAVYFTNSGYTVEDITGDRVVESSDYSLMENNVYYSREVIRP